MFYRATHRSILYAIFKFHTSVQSYQLIAPLPLLTGTHALFAIIKREYIKFLHVKLTIIIIVQTSDKFRKVQLYKPWR